MSNPFDINQLNSLIQQASDTIMCNSDCQREREAEKLKQANVKSQTNLATASNGVEIAHKKYIEFTEGESAYNDVLENQLQNKALMVEKKFSQNFNNDADKIKSQINSYGNILSSYDYAVELLRKYSKENLELTKELKDRSNEVLTNERKTYYEDQAIDSLKFYYHYLLLGIYAIFVICFAVFSFIYPSQTSFMTRIFILIGFIALPYFSTWILGMFIYLIYSAYQLLPKNVYKSIHF